jgi:hypothetical protein
MLEKHEMKANKRNREVVLIPKNQDLKYHFHNPNTPKVTADYILRILLKVNRKKIDQILQDEALKCANMER